MHISLGHKKLRPEHIKRGFEDSLTSMVFGTLRYLHPKISATFFRNLLGALSEDIHSTLTEFCSDNVAVEMLFWKNIASNGRVEPDLIVKLNTPAGAVFQLLIECKWESGESSTNQLLSQWNAIPCKEYSSTYHIYLVKHKQRGETAKTRNIEAQGDVNKGNWNDRLLVIDWLGVMESITKLSFSGTDPHQSNALKQWQKDMDAMFDRIGIRAFQGFSNIQQPFPSLQGSVFWDPFHGFEQLSSASIGLSSGNLFYN